jgi:Fibronectin type III domain
MIAYSIQYYQTVLHPVEPTGKVVAAGHNEVLLEGLKTNTNYTVFIQTYTNKGKSKPSELVTAVTDVDSEYSTVAM